MVELSPVKVFCNQVFSITFFNYMVRVGPPRLLLWDSPNWSYFQIIVKIHLLYCGFMIYFGTS